jgi:CPA1 family monovalent cation:H+ antiporter
VVQGLTLPFIIKLIKLKEIDDLISEEEEQAKIKIRLDKIALQIISEKYADQAIKNERIGFYKSALENEISNTLVQLESLECDTTEKKSIELFHQVLMQIYTAQRKELFLLRKEKQISDEEIRKAEKRLDLEQLKIEM